VTGSRNVPASGEAVNDIRQTTLIAAGSGGAPHAPGRRPWYPARGQIWPGLARIPI